MRDLIENRSVNTPSFSESLNAVHSEIKDLSEHEGSPDNVVRLKLYSDVFCPLKDDNEDEIYEVINGRIVQTEDGRFFVATDENSEDIGEHVSNNHSF